MKQEIPDYSPGLTIVQVGGREDSNVYIRMKIRAATEIGMTAAHVKLPRTISEVEVLYLCVLGYFSICMLFQYFDKF